MFWNTGRGSNNTRYNAKLDASSIMTERMIAALDTPVDAMFLMITVCR
jgi:hypothetical protein